jgi:arylsulfatase A-like enzyme
VEPSPGPSRLIEHLAEALEVPVPPSRGVLLDLDGLVPGLTVRDPRPAVVEARAGREARREESGRVGLAVPVPRPRSLVVQARLAVKDEKRAALHLYGLLPAELKRWPQSFKRVEESLTALKDLGECEESSVAPSEAICLRYLTPDPTLAGLLVVVEHPERGVRALRITEADLPDLRVTENPVLSRLVRRATGKTATGKSTRSSLWAPPGGRYVFPVVLPRDAELSLATGSEEGAASAPTRFVVRQDASVLLDETVAPDGKWHEHHLKLVGLPGRNAVLSFESYAVQGGPVVQGEPRGLWADPVLTGRSGRPNLLLLTVDALRPDHLSAYGYERDTSPNLEVLVKEGVRFAKVRSQGTKTWVSMTSLLTGRYPAGARVRDRGENLPADVPTLAELLEAQGYETFAGGDVGLFGLNDFSPFGDEDVADRDPGKKQYAVLPQLEQWLPRFSRGGAFVWLHMEQPHYALTPFEPHRYNPGYAGRFRDGYSQAEHNANGFSKQVTPAEQRQIVALYDASIRDADTEIGTLIRALKKAGAYENTLIVIAADHGENLGEHGMTLEHASPWESVLRVPLIMAWPGHLKGGQVVTGGAQLIDVVPTVLALLGLPAVETDGRDLSPALHGQVLAEVDSYADEDPIFSGYFGSKHLITCPDDIELSFPYGSVELPEVALYDVEKDPRELHDLSEAEPRLTRALKEKLEAQVKRFSAMAEGSERAPLGQQALDALREAGYLQDRPTSP